MRLRRLAAAALAANLLAAPVLAETNLPRLQAANPVFAKNAIKSRPSICNGFAEYGTTIERTVQMAFVDPLTNIAEDLARLFRPFFTDANTTGEGARRPRTSNISRSQSPSKMVQTAARKRLCG